MSNRTIKNKERWILKVTDEQRKWQLEKKMRTFSGILIEDIITHFLVLLNFNT